MKIRIALPWLCLCLFCSSCVIIRPGEVGVKRTLGKLSNEILDQGAYGVNPFVTKVIRTPIRTNNLQVNLSLPSKEGLNINSTISILYHIEKEKVPVIIEKIGRDYEQIIRNVFRSGAADVCSKFMAKDMHSGKRGEIEEQIASKMNKILMPKGINIEAVLMKDIQLPKGLYNSIEARLKAEQEALRMQFVLEQEKREAERKIVNTEGEAKMEVIRATAEKDANLILANGTAKMTIIEAEAKKDAQLILSKGEAEMEVIRANGTRDAQKIVSEGLTTRILELKRIEAFSKLTENSGSKLVITDGNAPFLLDPSTK
ncbi:MAG: SPFH domain-containing protein [Flavobacteriales bacterium]|nr:SPFH domain-containing protein [Flavobacteriales bacterium]